MKCTPWLKGMRTFTPDAIDRVIIDRYRNKDSAALRALQDDLCIRADYSCAVADAVIKNLMHRSTKS